MKFSIKEAFKSAFSVFCKNFFVVFSLSVFSVMFVEAFYFVVYEVLDISGSKSGYIFFMHPFVETCAFFLLTRASLPAFTGSKIKFRDYFCTADSKKATKEMRKFVSGFFLLTLLLFLLFIVPTFIFAIIIRLLSIPLISIFIPLCLLVFAETVVSSRYCFFYIEILGGNSVLQSFKNSAKITSGNLCKIFLLLFLLCLMNFVWLMFWFVLIEFVRVISIIGIIGTVISIIGISFTLSLSILVMIHIHAQLSLSKSKSLLKKKTELETEDNVTGSTEKELV